MSIDYSLKRGLRLAFLHLISVISKCPMKITKFEVGGVLGEFGQ